MNKELLICTAFPQNNDDTYGIPILELIKMNQEKNYIVLAPLDKEHREDYSISNAQIHYISYSNENSACYANGITENKNYIQIFKLLFAFMREILKYKDVVSSINAQREIPALASLLTKPLHKKAVSVTIRRVGNDLPSKIIYWIIKKYSDSIVCNSAYTYQYFSTLKKARIEESYCNPFVFKNLHMKRDIDVLTIGQFIPKKGYTIFIHYLGLLVKHRPLFKCVIISKGKEKSVIEQLIQNYDLSKNIEIIDSIPHYELVNYYNHTKIYVQPSITIKNNETETLGVCVKEAIACGCSILVSNQGNLKNFAPLAHVYDVNHGYSFLQYYFKAEKEGI